ncbi:phage Gp37/Gp68 family protein [Candidatus Poribacteria bacterium]|nr:phage Gp37/Gp68 family protein [Candidatus Poribacteria bacterium]MYH83235.1 phage Gp37/Gp68 family protein [Candidatus Poribacteria bacterium]MYK94280.1 phage Gp37/Gp68 family protein [Candidatus Poribacteria bacterium]
MAMQSKIEWTESTWNPVRGCTRVSEGCRFCYAERIAARFSGKGMAYEGLAKNTKAGPRWTQKVILVPELLNAPLKWKKPRRIFVNSMSDLFHEKVELSDIQKVFAVMEKADRHQFQVLTKRAERLLEFNSKLPWSPNVWMGVSVEDKHVTDRIEALRQTDAHIKFLSLEPLLGALPNLELDGIDWVIVGGESGPGAREMEKKWVIEIREQCADADVAFFFKQWGGKRKSKTGRELEGRTYDEMPV